MLPTEQEQFCEVVTEALGLYAKVPGPGDLEVWWRACKGFALADLERAFRAHADHPEDGKRAPRPVDVIRRVGAGARSGSQCAARDTTGQCAYPGLFSEGTSGDGPWFCPWHFHNAAGPDASRWIEVSRDVPYAEAMAKREARMRNDAIRAPGVVERAWDIAKRHGNRAWQVGDRWHLPNAQREAAD